MKYPYKMRPEKVSADSLPLPKGAATEATQQSLLASLGLITKAGDVQTITAASLDEIALDTDNLSGIKTGTDKIPADPAREGGVLTTISSTVSTAANQSTEITTLANINTQVSRLPTPLFGPSAGLTYGVVTLASCSATEPSVLDGQMSIPSITPNGRLRVDLEDEPSEAWVSGEEDDPWAMDNDFFSSDVNTLYS